MQPEDLPEYDFVWTTNQRIRTCRQHLARQVSVGMSIDHAEGVEPIIADMPMQYFPGKIFMEEKRRAIEEAKNIQADLILWCDGSKLNQRGTGAAVVWKLENSWLM